MTNTLLYIYRVAIVLVMALLMAGCEDNFLPDNPSHDTERYNSDKVMLAAGTTENSVTTRADAKTYYMPAAHRFVAKMYFKTNDSGEEYDTQRYHTAWLKVDNEGAGNSLYWKNTYPETAQREDKYHNDEYAPTFYWQNRKEHAFLAWTDLNKATSVTGNDINFDENSLSTYEYNTGIKEYRWVTKTITVRGNDVPFANELAIVNYYKDRNEGQAEFKRIAKEEVTPDQYSLPYYWDNSELESYCKVVKGNDEGEDKGENKRTSSRYLMYFFKKRLEYTLPEGFQESSLRQISMLGTNYYYVIDENNDPVARQVVENGETKYYQCTPYCRIKFDERLETDEDYTVYVFRRNEEKVESEIVEEYPALAFDLLPKTGVTRMSDQPDVLQALTIDQIPTSAVMENNRVHLYFKHQFAQVQVNLKNSADNSVEITADQIQKVELLGVTQKGYMFTSMNPDGTLDVPEPLITKDSNGKVIAVRSSTFKEVVAKDFDDAQLQTNPYGTTFNMFERTLTDDDRNISKIVKSYECITFGRLQAIRITWKEADTTDAGGNKVNGIVHEATYRVPEKNDHNQALRLLEAGKKYIWNIELRRGTLAVVRTDIIPWEENQEPYNADGYIVTTPSSSN